ncbi:MAG: bifunctional YncE family protein/alkaline phosphatase family protein [Myxococcota bacterium]|jgi:DNA-binding beta-propeller fold protein YncE|nr:bifunctional YncE family protein/alkaline phosphatase family protein [Myxococcota bacterium]
MRCPTCWTLTSLVALVLPLAGCADPESTLGPTRTAGLARAVPAAASPAAPSGADAQVPDAGQVTDGGATVDGGATGDAGDLGQLPPPCLAGDPSAEALVPGGSADGRTAIIPGGRRVSPAGTLVPLGRGPLGLALAGDGRHAFVTLDSGSSSGLQVIDLTTGTVTQTLTGFSAFRGLAVTPAGHVVVAAGGSGDLLVFAPGEDGALQRQRTLPLEGYLGDLTLSPDGRTVLVAANTSSLILALDLEDFTITGRYLAGNYPYDMVVDPERGHLFVSNLGDSTISVIDLASEETLVAIPTPQGPEGMAFDEATGRLYVPCADADVVVVIDAATLQIVDEFDLSHHPEGLLASSPTEVALSPDGGVLYAVQSDLNQVDLLDALTGELLGSLPTAWYPVAVQPTADGTGLVVVNAKGLAGGRNVGALTGLLQHTPLPTTAAELDAATAEARDNNGRPGRFFANACPNPVPHHADSPIEHVVLIVRENKTYDMVLGDLEGTNGDPSLTLFGREITPNLHALATTFVNMDNFYSDPENSIQGHLWTTQADCNDFVEKLRRSQLPLAGFEPASLSGSGSIFEHCLTHGVSFRNYGEVVTFGPELLGRLRDFIDPKFPFFNMNVRDEAKAREVIREWNLGIFPQFIYIALPNDHTFGARAGKPTPDSMVADNDSATGMLVDWISHSPYWEKTIVFIIEDDPQGSGDHVDAHRSICVVVSPWVKRGYLSSVHYSIPSIYRTIGLLLGLPPMNKNDALASPMYDIFRSTAEGPDLTPYQARPLAVPPALTPRGAPYSEESERLRWEGSGIDGVEGLGALLWKIRHGERPIPAHAKGIDR